jgi:hypothetical protein
MNKCKASALNFLNTCDRSMKLKTNFQERGQEIGNVSMNPMHLFVNFSKQKTTSNSKGIIGLGPLFAARRRGSRASMKACAPTLESHQTVSC